VADVLMGCFVAQLVFIPFAFVMSGRWSPHKAREDEAEYERRVHRELARLQAGEPAISSVR
jgi:MFS transporter, ACS family, D-galactonate transporter